MKRDVCSMCVRFATEQCDINTSGLLNHQVKYFAKVNSAFTIFLHGRFIVDQFKTVSLFSNRDSKVTKRTPSCPSSSSSSCPVTSPSSTTRLDSAERSNCLTLLTAATQHHTKMMYPWIIHHFRTFFTE